MKVVLENLTKIFPGRNKNIHEEVIAVNDFSFEIPDGKLIGLLGPSGCGKSTTLYMICGLQKPSRGKLYFGDDDVTSLEPENRGVGLVFQNYALYPHLTVKQNILFPLQNLRGEEKLSKDEMLKRAYYVAKLVQIDNLMDRKPSELSGGQQQRVAIARALVKMPRVLLLDEPLSNLDARLRLQTREEIRRIQRETGITTIFVTHDQEEAMSISDMIVVMKLGVLQQIGKPQDVYDSPANLFVAKFLGTPPINVFNGRVEGGKVYIGDDAVADATGVEDQNVFVGIRPEGFILDNDGPLHCKLTSVEVMGRDSSIVSTNDACISGSIRSIIDADCRVDDDAEVVRFAIKPNKIFIFAKEEVFWNIQEESDVLCRWNRGKRTIVARVGDKSYDVGMLINPDFDLVASEAKKPNVFVKKLMKSKLVQNKVVQFCMNTYEAKTSALVPGSPYKLVIGRTEDNMPLYFAGGADGRSLNTTADPNAAVQVYVDVVENLDDSKKAKKAPLGYSLYYMEGDKKLYPVITVHNGENHEKRIFIQED